MSEEKEEKQEQEPAKQTKTQKQIYFEELIELFVDHYYGIELRREETVEVPLPKIRLDMLFEIPKEVLDQGKEENPFPFGEVNLVQIKALEDTLTLKMIKQYLGQLYAFSTSSKGEDKTTTLIILSTKGPGSGLFKEDWLTIEATNRPWLYKIKAGDPAYIFVVNEIKYSKKDLSRFFAPFQSSSKIRKAAEFFQEIYQETEDHTVFDDKMLVWFMKLHPRLFKEIIGNMKIDKEEIVQTLYAEELEKREKEAENKGELKGIRESILEILEEKFGGKVSIEINEKLQHITTKKHLSKLLRKAATADSIEDFQTHLD